ncbi:PhoH family protein [Candidatus Methylacidithermus pantelleriae]|uniref:PhoH-like protein n=1 Tax=Candidatus Methylacidithermus pantelleriae TaxID=2744239 RepID=A0A8J2BNN1_9BACT|nr:PhoH family protein [Candidatus Methylacidithermus pantelleriae]CAF0699030.1 PhoH-like protein [Candidatus Methylacidithermus pantelleriae]
MSQNGLTTSSQILAFEDGRVVHSLLANEPKHLKVIEERFGVRVTTREGWVRIDGQQEGVEKVRRLFEELATAREQGLVIRKDEFRYAVDSVDRQGVARLTELYEARLSVSPKKSPITPKTSRQKEYVEALQRYPLVFGTGPAGTGKTYLAVAVGVALLRKEEVKRIVLTRPAVEAGEELGFLPGDVTEKVLPYLRPLYDALGDMLDPEELERLFDRGSIEIAPLAYMRGRTLAHSFVILDEAQNTSREQMLMFLTRLGPGSRCVVTGDPTQIDLPKPKDSGLLEALQALRGVRDIYICQFDESDVIRGPLVQEIVRAYSVYRGTRDAGQL